MTLRIAVLDDEPRMAEVVSMVLRKEGQDVDSFCHAEDFFDAFESEAFDLLLTDLNMPGMDGIEVLCKLKILSPQTPVILMTAYATVETALTAIKEGAFDYLIKPVDNARCRTVVSRALEQSRLERENRAMRQSLQARFGFDTIVAFSEGMQQVVELSQRAARSRSTALICGESGTGKELVARAIHFHSDRVGSPFVAVNCKALADGVLESELFGHEKGAFTGAHHQKKGLFERADGGTLFLDEIGEINEDFQAKLLRVLQEHEVQRVGGQSPVSVDVRLLAATNRDLSGEVKAGRFREDLYFRLAVIPITIPPLRSRRDDVLPIARSVLEAQNLAQGRKLQGWSSEVEAWMLKHSWPGNVRELENTLERGVVLARGDVIEYSDLILNSTTLGDDSSLGLSDFLDTQAADYIRSALRQSRGVRQAAAALLGIERTTLYRLMKRYGIEA